MPLAVKAAGVGMICAVAALLIRKNNAEAALLVGASAIIVILTMVLDSALGIRDFLEEMAQTSGLSSALILPVAKTVGIGFVTKTASDICKDANQTSVSSAIDTAGTAAAVCVALPLMKSVFRMISALL
jgi:stage III sporulation protein AD